MKKENQANTLLLTVIAIATLMVAVIGATFAYFSAGTISSESTSTIQIGAATLAIVFEDGSNSVTTGTLVEPKTTPIISKKFTLTPTNNTDMKMPYTLNLIITSNEFTLTNTVTTYSISYKLINTSGKTGQIASSSNYIGIPTYNNIGNIDVYSNNGTKTTVKGIELGTGYFAANTSGSTDAHTYTLEIYFYDDGTVQDLDESKSFAGYLDLSTGNSALN